MAKIFNALSGRELRTIVLKEVQQQLELDPRFDRGDAVTSASVVFTLRIEHYPGGEDPFQVSVSQVFKPPAGETLSPVTLRPMIAASIRKELEGDIRFSEHLTYPNVTCQHLTDITLTRPDGGAVQRELMRPRVETAVPASRQIDLTESRPRVSLVPAPVVDEREAKVAELRRQLAELTGEGMPDASAPVTTALSPSEVKRRDWDPYTATGLKIEAGFKPSPGAALAETFGDGAPVGSVQAKETIERIALGVTHPALEDGGMGAPDAVRREHGLFVPETQAVGKQIVDIPAGSF